MRVMDLPDWPPKPAEPCERESISIGEVQIESVNGDVKGHVSFVCKRYGESIPYDFFIWDKKTSNKFQKILIQNCGMTLFDIGFIALPQE